MVIIEGDMGGFHTNLAGRASGVEEGCGLIATGTASASHTMATSVMRISIGTREIAKGLFGCGISRKF